MAKRSRAKELKRREERKRASRQRELKRQLGGREAAWPEVLEFIRREDAKGVLLPPADGLPDVTLPDGLRPDGDLTARAAFALATVAGLETSRIPPFSNESIRELSEGGRGLLSLFAEGYVGLIVQPTSPGQWPRPACAGLDGQQVMCWADAEGQALLSGPQFSISAMLPSRSGVVAVVLEPLEAERAQSLLKAMNADYAPRRETMLRHGEPAEERFVNEASPLMVDFLLQGEEAWTEFLESDDPDEPGSMPHLIWCGDEQYPLAAPCCRFAAELDRRFEKKTGERIEVALIWRLQQRLRDIRIDKIRDLGEELAAETDEYGAFDLKEQLEHFGFDEDGAPLDWDEEEFLNHRKYGDVLLHEDDSFYTGQYPGEPLADKTGMLSGDYARRENTLFNMLRKEMQVEFRFLRGAQPEMLGDDALEQFNTELIHLLNKAYDKEFRDVVFADIYRLTKDSPLAELAGRAKKAVNALKVGDLLEYFGRKAALEKLPRPLQLSLSEALIDVAKEWRRVLAIQMGLVRE